MLQKLGADLNRVRQTVIQLLSGYTGGAGETTRRGPSESLTGRRAARARMPLRDALQSNEFPLCPSCRTSLAEITSVKTHELVAEDEPAQTIKIAYCSACGITLGIKVV